MKSLFSFLIPLVFCVVSAEAKTRPEIILCYDEWPPSTIFPTKKEPRRGFTIEMIESIYARHGYRVSYREVPYARGIDMTRKAECDLIAEVPEGQEKDVLFPVQTTFSYRQAFFVKAGNPWVYMGPESLKGLKIGNIVGYDYSTLDEDYHRFLSDPKNRPQITTASGNDGILQLMRMLALGRIDTFNEAHLIGSYVLAQNDLSHQIAVAGFFKNPLVERPAFSPRSSKSAKLMQIWDVERKKLRENRQDLEFLAKYGLRGVE